MKAKKKPLATKHRIPEQRKRKERKALAAAVSIAILLISSLLINFMLNQPSTGQTGNSTSEPKAAIVDQLSLTCPNRTFIGTATNILKQAGYTVDYYPGEQVTVEFYRNLPTHNYGVMILRVHSSAVALEEKELKETPVGFFTSENYSSNKYVWEQLTDQLMLGVMGSSPSTQRHYFGITPKFVTSSMSGKFQNTTVIMMGCEGLNNTKMAEAFIEKGAKVYISWNKSVRATQTDQATTRLLGHFLTERQTIKEAVTETNNEVGPDPAYDSILLYYPLDAGSYTLTNTVGALVEGDVEIQLKALPEKRRTNNP